jgi:hypothetical protein
MMRVDKLMNNSEVGMKKVNFIAVFSIVLACGFVLEDFLFHQHKFMMSLSVFLLLINILFILSIVLEYRKKKNRNLLWAGLLLFIILLEAIGSRLLKSL